MKLTILSILAISLFAGLCTAQDDDAYKAAMKSVNASAGGRGGGALGAAITAKDTAAAAAEAKKIQAGFDTILAYWTAKKVDDAIAFATTARDAAKTIADSSDADAQAAARMKLTAVCGQCHMAHRGGMPPNFEIK
jgi:mono/diheme cytochrome c family protein